MRPALVWLHRWIGLVLAGFLLLEGLTGSLLAFRLPLERLINPQLFAAAAGRAPLELSALAERFETQEPRARIAYFWISDGQAVVRVSPRIDPVTGQPWPIDFDHAFLDPYTGRELGHRREGDLAAGRVNLISFLYSLHMSLAAGTPGYWILGIVALAWSLDCFIALYLTLPGKFDGFLRRWKPAWLVKVNARPVRLNFDLHRAGGLWLWPVLFAFAWSSVMFNLNPVYAPVMSGLFDYRDGAEVMRQPWLRENANPRLGWREAEALGARALADLARLRGFTVIRPYGMAYIESFGVYTYAVESDRNVQRNAWSTSVWVDGDTGEIRDIAVPRGEHAGNTVETWLRALHFADVHDAMLYRFAVSLVGIVVAVLSITGIYLWWKKRQARRWSRIRARGAPGSGVAVAEQPAKLSGELS